MRLDHLLSKEEEVEIVSLFSCQKSKIDDGICEESVSDGRAYHFH